MLHTGYVNVNSWDGYFLYKQVYISDDPEFLPSDIYEQTQRLVQNFSWLNLMDRVRQGEREGIRYIVQIADMYYETLEG